MSFAFEVTDEDVWAVLREMGVECTLDSQEVKVALEKIQAQDDRVTKAALYGDDLDEQTRYAREEIKGILSED